MLNVIGVTSIRNGYAYILTYNDRVRRGCDRMEVEFITTCTISGYHHLSCEFESRSGRGVLDTPLCDKVCQ